MVTNPTITKIADQIIEAGTSSANALYWLVKMCACFDDTTEWAYDHVPDFKDSRRTLVEELQLRCSRCHRMRHTNQALNDSPFLMSSGVVKQSVALQTQHV